MTDALSQVDLLLTRRQAGRLVGDREEVDLDTQRQDLESVSGRANLTQALLNRLHTRLGELSALGHPDYGSRLYELVGELNNNRTRLLAERYIRECLAQETRILEIVEIEFVPPARGIGRDVLAVTVVVTPMGETPLTIDLLVNLGG
jgi:phage baseplate assembly protein W